MGGGTHASGALVVSKTSECDPKGVVSVKGSLLVAKTDFGSSEVKEIKT